MHSVKPSALDSAKWLILILLLVVLGPLTTESRAQDNQGNQGNQQPLNVNVANTPNVNVANTPNVNVANTPNVRDADNPARQPIQRYVSLSSDYTVPAGKRLVIEFVSGHSSIRNGDMVSAVVRTALGGTATIDHRIPLMQAYTVGEVKGYNFAQLTRLYADPGTTVSVSYSYLGTGTDWIVNCAISGYLVDLPE